MTSESEPFLAFSDKEENRSVESLTVEKPKSSKLRWRPTILFHVGLILLYSAITVSVLLFNGKSCRTIYTDGPLRNLDLQYETKSFMNLFDENRYTGDPSSNDVDTAWDTLLRRMHIRVTTAELGHRNQTSVALPEGGGHLAWLEVFHELHCINMLRQWINHDYYYPNFTSEDLEHLSVHGNHCLDMLRQASMCHADTSLTTFVWDETASKPMFNVHMAPRTCVNFDRLVASTQDRWVGAQEIKELQNPLMSGKE